jgi:hypothetical protein
VKRFAIGAVFVLALAAAGCGGGGGKSLSKEEYASKLNGICSDFNAKQKAIGRPQSISDLGDKGSKLLAAFDDAISKVKKLKPPGELKDRANRFVSLGEQERDLVSDLIKAIKAKDLAKAQQLGARIEPLDKESNNLARQMGAPACAQSG